MNTIIKEYKKHISNTLLKDEIYKWELVRKNKGRPNTEALNFHQEINDIKFDNLVYAMAKAVIKHIARDNPEELRKAFINLFDESKNLTERINSFNVETLRIYRGLGETLSHHQDERTIATYLTFHSPDKYTFYKSSFYKKYCKYLGVKVAPTNEKVAHYLSLIDELIEKYIKTDLELIELVKSLIPEYYDGTNHKLLAQDILYQMFDKKEETRYWIFQGNPNIFDFETALRQELLTNWNISAHKSKINVGDKVILWITGSKSGCYALAEVTSEPQQMSSSPDDYLWKGENKNELKANLKITHNLVDSPILKSSLTSIKELNNLKVGNQGTNFSATKKEYEKLLELMMNRKQKKYWLYAPGENASKWEEFYNIGIMGLGWDEIGDLKLLGDRDDIIKVIQTTYKTESKSYNNALANIEFRDMISVGDIIITKKGRQEYLGYGIVTSDYYYDKTRESYQKCRKVDWKKKGNWNEPNDDIVIKTLTDITKYPDYVNRLIDLIGIEKEEQKINTVYATINLPLNTILYGPPGTGKTYNTVRMAADIVKGKDNVKNYEAAKTIFNENLGGQIEFITFHQNYSYEDFIQGLRPNAEDSGGLSFKKVDGVFKRIADRAFANIKESEKAPEEISQVKAFDNALEILKDKILESDEPIRINDTAYFTAVEDDAFRYSGDNWTLGDRGFNGFRMKYSDLERFFEEGVKERKEIKNLTNISGLAKQHATYFIKTFELVKSLMPSTSFTVQKTEKKNYVIIIDEINRANISRVFGELITLIEEDKRSGGDLPMKVTLPSGDTFIVPSNLYIIGTMNTADKSIALLDIALRRRFTFVGMYPNSTFVNTSVKDQFELLNKEIVASKGRDFQIGHSYFMGNDFILNETMNNKVIPLLMEYFMNDEETVIKILQSSGFSIKKDSWPLQIQDESENENS